MAGNFNDQKFRDWLKIANIEVKSDLAVLFFQYLENSELTDSLLDKAIVNGLDGEAMAQEMYKVKLIGRSFFESFAMLNVAEKSKEVVSADPVLNMTASEPKQAAPVINQLPPKKEAGDAVGGEGKVEVPTPATTIRQPPQINNTRKEAVPEEKGIKGFVNRIKARFSKPKVVKVATTQTTLKPAKKSSKIKWVLIIVVLLILVFGFFSIRSGSLGDMFSGSEAPQAPVVPDEALTNMTPEEKEEWANSQLNNSITDTFLTKPEPFMAIFQDFGKYLNWLLYVAAVPLLFLQVFRERTQTREFSDIKVSAWGVGAMFIAVIVAVPLGTLVQNAGLAQAQFFVFIVLGIGFLINMVLQWSAYQSGEKDYSVFAMGLYVSGIFIKWWFPNDAILATFGSGLLLAGMAVLLIEINRNEAMKKSIIGAGLTLLFFVVSYVGMFILLQSYISGMVIPLDSAEQASVAARIAFFTRGQIFLSAVVGIAIAVSFGFIYGMFFLSPRGSDGTVDIKNARVLDPDTQSLFVMFLFLFLPWIWLLPKVVMLVLSL